MVIEQQYFPHVAGCVTLEAHSLICIFVIFVTHQKWVMAYWWATYLVYKVLIDILSPIYLLIKLIFILLCFRGAQFSTHVPLL